jgi:hypothetical protein
MERERQRSRVCARARGHTHTSHTHTHARTRTHTHTHTHTHSHARTHTHTHTHAHTHLEARVGRRTKQALTRSGARLRQCLERGTSLRKAHVRLLRPVSGLRFAFSVSRFAFAVDHVGFTLRARFWVWGGGCRSSIPLSLSLSLSPSLSLCLSLLSQSFASPLPPSLALTLLITPRARAPTRKTAPRTHLRRAAGRSSRSISSATNSAL